MIDLRSELGRLDQPGPSPAEMRARVERRTTVVRTRRRVLGAVGAALAVTGIAWATVSPGSGTSPSESVETRLADQPETVPTTTASATPTTTVDDDADGDAREGPARPPAATTVSTAAASAVPTTAPGRGAAPPGESPTPSTSPPPAAEGCRAEGYEQGVYDNNGGLGTGGYPRCTYVATRPGGYRTYGTKWRIEIRRDGRFVDARRGGTDDPPCGPVGTIEPGDEVEVWMQAGLESAADPGWIEAGPEAHC